MLSFGSLVKYLRQVNPNYFEIEFAIQLYLNLGEYEQIEYDLRLSDICGLALLPKENFEEYEDITDLNEIEIIQSYINIYGYENIGTR